MLQKIFLCFIALLLSAAVLIIPNSIQENSKEKGPQWISQWFEMKKDAQGNIPILMSHQWALQDAVLNKTNSVGILDSAKNIGPGNIGGRTRALIIDWSDTTHYFAGSVAGGLWESKNAGSSWRPVNDNQENLNITAITQSPINKRIYYYCTGEPYPIADASSNTGGQLGGGVFKSTDGGLTFSVLASSLNANFIATWDIKHALNDSNTFYVATESKGLFKSTDGGATFINVFPSTTGITHIEVFNDGSILIARRTFGIYKSANGNLGTFNLLSNGFASGSMGLIDFAVCKNFPNVMFAVVSASSDASVLGTYKTSDGGNTWRTITTPTTIGFSYTWFCLTTAICPTDTNKLFVGSVAFGYSANGGQTWVAPTSANSHSDYHILVNVPGSSRVLCGNDGGVFRYDWNNLGNFSNLNNGYTVTQYYCGSYFRTGLSAIMGAQDNGSQRVLSANTTFTSIQGADGCFNAINQNDDNKGFVSYQSASIFKAINLRTTANLTAMTMPTDQKWFINPLEINPEDGNQIFFPSKAKVYRSIGTTFSAITNALSKQPYALGLSADTNAILYFGGANMLLSRIDSSLTTTAGKEKDLTTTKPSTLTTDFIGSIKVQPGNRNTIFITLTNYNTQPRVWKVSNTDSIPVWTNISGNLPASLPCNSIEVDPQYPNTNFMVATDFGLYTTSDGGSNWVKTTDIPNVCIYNIKLRAYDRKLFIFSHGRGVWVANVMPYSIIKPKAGFTLPSPQICEGDLTNFSDYSFNSPTQYRWMFENGIPSTSNNCNATTSFYGAGIKKIKLIVSNSFGSDSIEKTITVIANPKPILSRAGNLMQCNLTTTSYTWYVNNTQVTGNAKFIATDYSGWYKVKINNGNGCFAISDSIEVFPSGISNSLASDRFYFYPNPAIKNITAVSSQPGVVAIYTLDGRLAYSVKIEQPKSLTIPTEILTKGTYILVFETQKTATKFKFIHL